ncbi:MAG: hypothetical protein WEA58_01240 [Balneolaceae bacterium]
MKIKYRLIIALFCLLMLPVTDIIAQSGGFTGSFSRIGFAPRGMAMGNAMTAVDQEGSYGYYNPALAAKQNENIQIDLSSTAMKFDRQLHMVHAQIQLPPSAAISFSLLNARVGGIDGRTQSGFSTETLSTNEFQLISNFGIRFMDDIWGGIGIKYNVTNYHSEVPKSTGIGLDAGVRAKITPKWTIAATVQDLFASNQFETTDLYGPATTSTGNDSFPVRLKTGTSYEPVKNLLLSFDYEVQLLEFQQNSTIILNENRSRDTVQESTQIVRMGGRYNLHERITIRGGLQVLDLKNDTILQPGAGFSLHLPFDRFTPAIDYAFMREPSGISTMHVFSMRLNL